MVLIQASAFAGSAWLETFSGPTHTSKRVTLFSVHGRTSNGQRCDSQSTCSSAATASGVRGICEERRLHSSIAQHRTRLLSSADRLTVVDGLEALGRQLTDGFRPRN
jgi:hypothetical protein